MGGETVELRVAMTCEGCSGAVTRILGRLQGVASFDVSLETQKVTVQIADDAALTPEGVLEAVAKSGKQTDKWA